MNAKKAIIKDSLHKNNLHRRGYDFSALTQSYPPLSSFIISNKFNQQATINFSDTNAVKALNFALLKKYYHIEHWDFPAGYLCPPIPGRIDYIHYLADLLKESISDNANKISVLDIGTGASCIYPILGARTQGWHFVASDIDPISIKAANANVKSNKGLAKQITCRLQQNSTHIFDGIIQPNEYYHLTMCNPPFHKSLADATKGTLRKWQNLSKDSNSSNRQNNTLNFGGQKGELWCQGGEVSFIRQMIKESKQYREQVLWFTCLVSKKDHLSAIKLSLKKANAAKINVVKMAQGQKISRFIAWSFSAEK
ncbi:23S rRNA (adenine(1618)-N(6))-methyltransferase RlmF [Candidatus Colwellia aromaticivorans]|uniref:23S rRNA (adenine(1618)-N(6))-methyltransferase RlmF n=1 Tax=Candidatus Colwellia aromaticivorans TaxID=2267621 RepID=UPI000DF30B33|nr:23S rRNA (adenine(1618)-N(6))-methyltransferase RlmF [Candidatus Colwellia aromaticivorans]